jgi:hypothetical protein
MLVRLLANGLAVTRRLRSYSGPKASDCVGISAHSSSPDEAQSYCPHLEKSRNKLMIFDASELFFRPLFSCLTMVGGE